MYLPYRAGADECYNGIELYIASLNMLHSRPFIIRKQQQQQHRNIDLATTVDLVSCNVLVSYNYSFLLSLFSLLYGFLLG